MRAVSLLLLFSLFVTLGMGKESALAAQSIKVVAAEKELVRAEAGLDTDRLASIAKGTAALSGCGKLPLLEKPACYRDFAGKTVKVGAGLGMFAYGIHYLHKDTVSHFGTVKKEVTGLQKMKEAFKQDPSTIADPEYRKQVEGQIRAVAAGAQSDIDKLIRDVLETIETILVMIQLTLMLIQLILMLAKIVGDPKFQKAVNSVKGSLEGISKAFDQMNAGFAQMNRGLNGMNDALDDINGSLDDMNKSIAKANKGMGQLNEGIGEANKGMGQLNEGIGEANKGVDDMNKAVPAITKAAEGLHEVPAFEFDFSDLGKTWSDNSSSLDSAEQQRRMSILLGMLPGVGDGKGIVEAVTGKDLVTGEHVSGFDRGLGSLAVLRWLKLGGKLIPDDIRGARKGDVVFECNSFPAGTPVLMANGSHKPIEDVRAGDLVLATDPGGDGADTAAAGSVGAVHLLLHDQGVRPPDRGRRPGRLPPTGHCHLHREPSVLAARARQLGPGRRAAARGPPADPRGRPGDGRRHRSLRRTTGHVRPRRQRNRQLLRPGRHRGYPRPQLHRPGPRRADVPGRRAHAGRACQRKPAADERPGH
ncbi:hypothetical protein BGK70_31375 [Streptomyces agglomeratus]|nr:hypothetical protein BGK70_31375 [Streptomyces agglomeratus]